MTKPLLLIDVDGPLNPDAATANTISKHNRRNVDKWYKTHVISGYRVRLTPWHGKELLKLTDTYELTWATTWEHDANALIGPRIGLPELPVIEFSNAPESPSTRLYFKTHTIIDYADGRPFAWVDDEISLYDTDFTAARHKGKALLRKIDPALGLRDNDFTALARWATRLTDREQAPCHDGSADT